MRPDVIVVVPPERQFSAGVVQAVEQFFIQQLIPQAPVERLDEGVLLRFALCTAGHVYMPESGVDVVPVDVVTCACSF